MKNICLTFALLTILVSHSGCRELEKPMIEMELTITNVGMVEITGAKIVFGQWSADVGYLPAGVDKTIMNFLFDPSEACYGRALNPVEFGVS